MIKRNTIQCALVLETVNKLRCHATADEVYDAIVQEHPNISRATVYRNLNRLSQLGRIHKMEIPGGADRFDHECYKHYHIRCEKCGRVFDVDMEYIAMISSSRASVPTAKNDLCLSLSTSRQNLIGAHGGASHYPVNKYNSQGRDHHEKHYKIGPAVRSQILWI